MSIVYSISRDCGSGGGDAARCLHDMLGIPFYDRSVIGKELARQGFPVSFMDVADNLEANMYRFEAAAKDARFHQMSPQEITAELEREVIRAVADKGDCIILDRCAKEILENTDHHVVSIFITAPYDYRLKRVMAAKGLKQKKAADFIRRHDSRRRMFFEYYTGKEWNVPSSYDATFNIESMGKDRLCALMASGYRKFDDK